MIGLMMLAATSPYFMTGNQLYQHCTANDEVCAGYIEGIVDGSGIIQEAFNQRAICLPDNANVRQIADVVIKYLRDHPESRAQSAGALSVIALTDAFGCKRKAS